MRYARIKPSPRIRSAQPVDQRGDRPLQPRLLDGREIPVRLDLQPALARGAFHLLCPAPNVEYRPSHFRV